jgi:hypothetical protein
MIPYQGTLLNRSRPDPEPAKDRRDSEYLTYLFDFRLVPTGKVGAPDEAQSRQHRRVKVQATKSLMDEVEFNNPGIPGIVDRMLYWSAREALEQGQEETTLDPNSPRPNVDLSRVVIEKQFGLNLPGPVMGFHAGR